MSAASLPSGFTESLIANAMSNPTAMAIAPDGRIFICQQSGSLRVVENGSLLAPPFLTLSVNSSGERGLLGVAFDPNFAANNFVYVYYTTSSAPVHNRVSRFTANGNVAVSGSEVVLLDLNNLTSATNHNGGAMHFGTDGKLYVAVGENATSSNSQTLSNLLGKMLRINTDPLNLIPTDNPFFNQTTGNNRAIWTLGLRNPFTFSFQPTAGGRMFINDVGQNTWEEINDGIAGSNYGWPTCEGLCNPPNANFRDPLYLYSNDASTCAITGGAFYNPTNAQFPAQYVGKYFFADYCAGWIKFIDPNSPPGTGAATGFATGLSFAVDLQVGNDGSLYYLQRGTGSTTGQLWRIQYTANQGPTITQHPTDQTVSLGQSATFTAAASGTMPLNYQWRRNNVDIPNATSPSYTISGVTAGDNGAQFSCFVSNGFGNALTNAATLTVVSNLPPTATITQPVSDTFYSGGQTITFAGTGTDPEQGTLPASAFTWEVTFHHDTHTHPFVAPLSGQTGGSFVIPTTGETAADVWYRIHLTVTDAGGLTHSVFRDVFPRTVTLTLAANPSGVRLTLDGQPMITPYSVTGVVGIERVLGVVSPQNFNGQVHQFVSWSDAGAATHTISTPTVDTTYTATFNPTGTIVHAKRADFDGDGKSDLSVWRGSVGDWLVVNSSNGSQQSLNWGTSAAPYFDAIVPGDYDGDGKTDQAVWRGSDGIWYIRRSSDGQPILDFFGTNQAPYFDKPTQGDYDGDGKTDLAVWRPTDGNWFVKKSSDGGFIIQQLGINGDTPVPGDYDGDGKIDFAVWRGSTGQWLIKLATGGTQSFNWGAGFAPYFDVPVQADYDGDGKTDLAIWRGADEVWYIRKSSDGQPILQLFGTSNAPYFDIPTPGDYDGDGKYDIAVWRPSTGVWFVLKSTDNGYLIQPLGQNGDTPVPAKNF